MVEDHFPEFYRKADHYSATWQRSHLWSERIQLIALLIAAAAASPRDPLAVLVVVCFACATLAHGYRLASRADQKWWNGRAGAESARTISWRFVVGGDPFGMDAPHSEVEFANRLTQIATKVANLVPVSVSEAHVSDQMRAVRAQPLEDRISLYLNERIHSQLIWYSQKSDLNVRRGRNWSITAIGAQAAALTLGIVGVAEHWDFDFVGVFAAAAASAVAWTAVKQFDVLGRSYAVASNELGSIEVRMSTGGWNEASWAAFVNDAEEAISREHTSWLASRAT